MISFPFMWYHGSSTFSSNSTKNSEVIKLCHGDGSVGAD